MEELLSKSSPEAVELIEKINGVRKIDNSKHIDYACDLFDLSQECGNDDLKNYASCVLGDACCQNGDYSQALYYLSSGVQGLAKTDEHQLTCRCYNELGIIFRSEGHFITSEEYFINSIELARANRLYTDEAIACSNFASLCDEMDATMQALEYHYRSIECCEFIEDTYMKGYMMVIDYAYIIRLYVDLGKRKKASEAFMEMEKVIEANPEFNNMFDTLLARLYYYRFRNDEINTNLMKQRCLEAFYNCEEYIVYFDETKKLIRFLMDCKEYSELERMFERIETVCEGQDIITMRLYIENCRIQIYDELNDAERVMASYKKYRIFTERKTEDNKRSFLATLHLRSELAQQRTKNLFLLAAAETDPLTGIANRLKMNAVIDELFEMANKEGKNLAVEMMDVDCFKQVNDTYGHSKGDELLVNMGKVLKGMTSDNIFVARYGGDEFVIYYYDMTDEQVIEKAKYINKSMKKVGESLGLKGFSVSQGIVNHAPRPMNRAWDYLNAADLTLYYVKNHGKANVRLVHRATELETQQWNKVF